MFALILYLSVRRKESHPASWSPIHCLHCSQSWLYIRIHPVVARQDSNHQQPVPIWTIQIRIPGGGAGMSSRFSQKSYCVHVPRITT